MSNEIKIKISADTNPAGFKQAERGLHDVETAADKAGNQVAALDRKIAGLSNKTVKVNVDVDAKNIDIPALAGGGSESVKVKVEPDRASVQSFFTKFAGAATGAAAPALKLMGSHAGITVGAAAGVAAAPVLLSALGSALAAGAGAGVLGAGVAAAIAGDRELQAAGKAMAGNVFDAFKDEAASLKAPIRESFTVLEDAGERVAVKWGDTFDELRGDLVPFVKDVVSGAERISDSLTNVAKGSGKESLDGLGDTWKLLADGVGDFVEIVADNGPEAADNLRLVAGATGDLLRQTGNLIDITAGLANNEWVTGPLIPALRDHYNEAADATGTFAHHTAGLSDAMIAARDAAEEERASLEGLAKELKAQADPVFAIVKAQDDLKAAQKATAEATKEHGKNSAEAEAALQKQALAALSLEANIGKLGDTFDGKMTPAMRATFKAAGLTDGAIDRLEKQFRDAKRAGDQFSRTYRARAVLDGFKSANGQLDGLLRDLRAFDGVWTATMITNYKTFGKPGSGGGLAHGGIKGAANGSTSSDLTWVGEQGPELVDLPPGSRVHSNPDSTRMAAAADGGGGGPITINLVVDGKVLAQAMMDPQREIVRTEYGGSAQQAWGR